MESPSPPRRRSNSATHRHESRRKPKRSKSHVQKFTKQNGSQPKIIKTRSQPQPKEITSSKPRIEKKTRTQNRSKKGDAVKSNVANTKTSKESKQEKQADNSQEEEKSAKKPSSKKEEKTKAKMNLKKKPRVKENKKDKAEVEREADKGSQGDHPSENLDIKGHQSNGKDSRYGKQKLDGITKKRDKADKKDTNKLLNAGRRKLHILI